MYEGVLQFILICQPMLVMHTCQLRLVCWQNSILILPAWTRRFMQRRKPKAGSINCRGMIEDLKIRLAILIVDSENYRNWPGRYQFGHHRSDYDFLWTQCVYVFAPFHHKDLC